MSWLSICTAKAALAAALASGATYAGVALTTPAAPPAPVAVVAGNPTCPAAPANTGTFTPQGCSYYTDLKTAGVPLVSNAVPNMLNLCTEIHSIGASKAAQQLVSAWQNQPTPLSYSDAETYVRINQEDVTCR